MVFSLYLSFVCFVYVYHKKVSIFPWCCRCTFVNDDTCHLVKVFLSFSPLSHSAFRFSKVFAGAKTHTRKRKSRERKTTYSILFFCFIFCVCVLTCVMLTVTWVCSENKMVFAVFFACIQNTLYVFVLVLHFNSYLFTSPHHTHPNRHSSS